MKALVIRPGISEISKELLINEEVHPTYELLKVPLLWEAFVISGLELPYQPVIVANTLQKYEVETEALDVMSFGIAITREGINKQNREISAKLKSGSYDLVYINCRDALEYVPAKRIASLVKEALPGSVLIAGGDLISIDAVDSMKDIPEIDIIIKKDFEPIAEKLLTSLQNSRNFAEIPNIVYRNKNEVFESPDLEMKLDFIKHSVPLDLNPFKEFFPLYTRLSFLEASRGCPCNCNYCNVPSLHDSYSKKLVDKVALELEYAIDFASSVYGDEQKVIIDFADSMWGLSREWINDFLDILTEKKESFKKEFIWRCKMRIDHGVNDLFPQMYSHGCRCIDFGAESFNPATVRNMNKSITPDVYVNAITDTVVSALNAGITSPAVALLFGIPGDDMYTMALTLEGMNKIKDEYNFNNFYLQCVNAYPNTELWNILDDEKMKEKYNLNMVVPKRFWRKGIPTILPMFDCSIAVDAGTMAGFAVYQLEKKTERLEELYPEWAEKYSILKKVNEVDMICTEELHGLAAWIRGILQKNNDFSVLIDMTSLLVEGTLSP